MRKPVESLQFRDGTPLEYLDRWTLCNEVFGDRASLLAVVKWIDGAVSILMRQPHYGGRQPRPEGIRLYFLDAGWQEIRSTPEHKVFFNFAFNVIAIDAVPRNCYIWNDQIQPFDVILSTPTEELEHHLRLYPDGS